MNKLLRSIFLVLLLLSQYMATGMVVYDCQVTGKKSFTCCDDSDNDGNSFRPCDAQSIRCCLVVDADEEKSSQALNECCDIEQIVPNDFILPPIESKRGDQIDDESSPGSPLHYHINKNQCIDPHLQIRFTPHLLLSTKSNSVYIHHCSFLL